MQIQQYLHTAILVRDRDRAHQFYGEVLGLPEAARSLNFPGLWYQVGALQIHLIEQSAYHTELWDEQKWGRNAHIALSVEDVEQAYQELTAAGYAVQRSSSGRPALFVRDPDGNIVELSQAA